MVSPLLLYGLVLLPGVMASTPDPAPNPVRTAALAFDDVARRAREARDRNQLDEAIRWYREGVRQRPRWDEGLWYVATLLYEKDRFAEAGDAFRRFLAVKPEAGPGWALLGLCQFKQREFTNALTSLEHGTELGYGTNAAVQSAALFHLSMLLVRAGQFDRAVAPLTRLARSEAESNQVVEVAGLMLLRMPKLPEEIDSTSRSLVVLAGRAAHAHLARDAAQASSRFRELIERFPKAPNVHYGYAIFLLGSDSKAAMDELHKEIEIQPQSPFAHLELAFELIRRGESQEAIAPAEVAVKLAPRLFAAHNALGRALTESGSLERGILALETAARLAPESPEMHFALARAYAKAGRKDEAARARAVFTDLDRKRRDHDTKVHGAATSGGPS